MTAVIATRRSGSFHFIKKEAPFRNARFQLGAGLIGGAGAPGAL